MPYCLRGCCPLLENVDQPWQVRWAGRNLPKLGRAATAWPRRWCRNETPWRRCAHGRRLAARNGCRSAGCRHRPAGELGQRVWAQRRIGSALCGSSGVAIWRGGGWIATDHGVLALETMRTLACPGWAGVQTRAISSQSRWSSLDQVHGAGVGDQLNRIAEQPRPGSAVGVGPPGTRTQRFSRWRRSGRSGQASQTFMVFQPTWSRQVRRTPSNLAVEASGGGVLRNEVCGCSSGAGRGPGARCRRRCR